MRAVGRSLVLLPLLAMTLTSCTFPSHFQAMRSEIAALAVGPGPPPLAGPPGPGCLRGGVARPQGGTLAPRGAESRVEEDYVLALGIDAFIDPDGMTFR